MEKSSGLLLLSLGKIFKIWGCQIVFQTKLVTLAFVIFVTGSASTNFVMQSIATIRNLSFFFHRGNGPIISIPHWAKGHGEDIGVIVSPSLVCTRLSIGLASNILL